MTYVGIDYGRTSQTNRDKATGIHFGVISQHSIMQAWCDSSEAHYGEPTCPRCGNVAEGNFSKIAANMDDWPQYSRGGCMDYACDTCEHTLDSSDVFGDEPLSFFLDDDEYAAESCLDNDVMLCKSPYYTFAQFCSPCVPGAGNLDNPAEDGPRTYCFGHDWFEDGVAPYPVYSVATGELVSP